MSHVRTWACDKPDGDGCDGKHSMKKRRKPQPIEIVGRHYSVQEWSKRYPIGFGISCLTTKEAKRLAKWLTQAVAYLEGRSKQ